MKVRLLALPLMLALLSSTAFAEGGYWTWSYALVSRSVTNVIVTHFQTCLWRASRTWHPDSGPTFTEDLGSQYSYGTEVPIWQPAPACPKPTSY